jgi:hypothetical protein
MEVKMHAENPNEIVFSMTVNLDLGSWKKLVSQLRAESWPASDLVARISAAVYLAEREFTPPPSPKPQISESPGDKR